MHPAIKKKLCETAGEDRAWLSKIRPVRGHNYHFHVRLRCPPGSPGCRGQKPPSGGDGCGAELDRWYKWLHARLKPRPKPKKPIKRRPRKKRPPMMLAQLPNACRAVLLARPVLVAPQLGYVGLASSTAERAAAFTACFSLSLSWARPVSSASRTVTSR